MYIKNVSLFPSIHHVQSLLLYKLFLRKKEAGKKELYNDITKSWHFENALGKYMHIYLCRDFKTGQVFVLATDLCGKGRAHIADVT